MYLDFRVDEVEFNQLVEMSLGQEIKELCNDDFKDSDDKCPVFREAVVGVTLITLVVGVLLLELLTLSVNLVGTQMHHSLLTVKNQL